MWRLSVFTAVALSFAPLGAQAQDFYSAAQFFGAPVNVALSSSSSSVCTGTVAAVGRGDVGQGRFCNDGGRTASISATVSQTNYIVPAGKTAAGTVQNRIRIGDNTKSSSNSWADVSAQTGTFQTAAVSIVWDPVCPAQTYRYVTDHTSDTGTRRVDDPVRSMAFIIATQSEDTNPQWEIAKYNVSDEFTGWDITIVRVCYSNASY